LNNHLLKEYMKSHFPNTVFTDLHGIPNIEIINHLKYRYESELIPSLSPIIGERSPVWAGRFYFKKESPGIILNNSGGYHFSGFRCVYLRAFSYLRF
jgi:hypothetical protein